MPCSAINVVTIFPEFFAAPLGAEHSRARARRRAASTYHVVDLRDFTHDRHRTVDDAPVRRRRRDGDEARAVLRGGRSARRDGADRADVARAAAASRTPTPSASRQATELTLLCGHYKDVDQRVADHLATEELSLGDFVLSGGEPAALAIIDATVRLLPGAMSDLDSARGDSFFDRELSAPSYTRPPEYRGHAVPEVLLSGDHKKIAEWREAEGEAAARDARAEGGRALNA